MYMISSVTPLTCTSGVVQYTLSAHAPLVVEVCVEGALGRLPRSMYPTQSSACVLVGTNILLVVANMCM